MEWKASSSTKVPPIKYRGRPAKWKPIIEAFLDSDDGQWWNEFSDNRELYRAAAGLNMAIRGLNARDKIILAIRRESPIGVAGNFLYIIRREESDNGSN